MGRWWQRISTMIFQSSSFQLQCKSARILGLDQNLSAVGSNPGEKCGTCRLNKWKSGRVGPKKMAETWETISSLVALSSNIIYLENFIIASLELYPYYKSLLWKRSVCYSMKKGTWNFFFGEKNEVKSGLLTQFCYHLWRSFYPRS